MSLDDVVLLPTVATPADVQRAVVDHGHSRHVLADANGEPLDYVHMKDVMELDGDPRRHGRLTARASHSSTDTKPTTARDTRKEGP